jgi:glucose/arabinose dehydrogenase
VPKVLAGGQGGLLDVTLAKDFAKSGNLFLSFTEAGRSGGGTSVARARLVRDGDGARLEDTRIIFSTKKKTGTHQYGSRIVLEQDGNLFVTTGDAGQPKRAQDPSDAAGKVLHITPDGSPAPGNPWPDGKKGLPQIWSIGHRNIDGAALDPATGRLWTVEHGAKGGDEINQPEAGRNYGWPVISYGVNYDGTKIGIGTAAPGYEQPEFYWDPSIAPSGLAIYDGKMFPEWKGDFLVGALKFQLVSRLTRDKSGKITEVERMFKRAFGRIRDVNVAPDGSIWLLTDEDDGEIIRLSRAE